MAAFVIRVFRFVPGQDARPRYERYVVEGGPRTTVLDALMEIKRSHAPDLAFRHSCHHASCGTCAMRINGVERLACVTRLASLGGGEIVVEPLAHFPLLGDLVVDMEPFYAVWRELAPPLLRRSEGVMVKGRWVRPEEGEGLMRFEDCLECGACLSACPSSATDARFIGPAALAMVERCLSEPRDDLNAKRLLLADTEHGLWRCHMAFECSEVCPSNVDPATRLMRLRWKATLVRLKRLLSLPGRGPKRSVAKRCRDFEALGKKAGNER